MNILADEVKEQLLKLIKDGLQFVDQPNKYACRNCGNVPIFHYTYPCSHLYCRDCYKIFAKQKKKCKVCQTDLGFEMLQNRAVEFEIYNLKVICPNSLSGCQDILQLYRILIHTDECRFSTKNLLPILFTSKQSVITKETCDHSEIENAISEMKVSIETLTKSNQHLLELEKRLVNENKSITCTNKMLSEDVQKMKNENNILSNEIRKVKNDNLSLSQEFQKVKEENKNFTSETQTVINQIISIVNTNDKSEKNNRKLINKRITDLKKQHDQHKRDSLEDDIQFGKSLDFLEQKIKQCSETVANMETKVTNRIKTLETCQKRQIFEDIGTQDKKPVTESIAELKQYVRHKIHTVEMSTDALIKRVDLIDPKLIEAERKSSFQKLNLNKLTTQEIQMKMSEIRGWKNGTLLWQIENYSGLKNSFFTSLVYSDPFYPSDGGHKMGAALRFDKDGCLTAFIQFGPGKDSDLLPSGYHYRATFSILNQSAIKKKKDATLVVEPRFGTSVQDWMRASNFNSVRFKTFTNKENLAIYSKNDTICIKVLVEPLSSLFGDSFDRNDVLLWKIVNYEKTKQESLDFSNEYIYSDYFYSSESEYRMQARITWKLDSIVCEIFFLVGESDNELDYFDHTCKMAMVRTNHRYFNSEYVLGKASLNSDFIGLNNVKLRMSSDCCYLFTISYSKAEVEPFLHKDKVVFKISA